eukprot:CAMPEP_0168516668 /NCGR_PEP_ID=MMETSP0405-20121227/5541_1 /TAXON_ID=498012 /ORGANISM="Trichosphaerium sp, Strain Am-I-7 wt" /LENGTH=396 /DNA_ID=CAMNT_0008536427 /DNA_START=550 /DNA_END=1737 /DNA_ORIENTATION=-
MREDNSIAVTGHNPPPPITRWNQCTIPQTLQDALKACKFYKPTPIQMQAIPVLQRSNNENLIATAQTGSGKTLAFLVSIFTDILNANISQSNLVGASGPAALVLVPTRELALQIFSVYEQLAEHVSGVRAVCLYGGVPEYIHAQMLSQAPNLLIATPGRLWQCIQGRYTTLSECRFVVMDEADKLVEAFEEDVATMLDMIPPPPRKIALFSATMPLHVMALARKKNFLTRAIKVSIGNDDLTTNDKIRQYVEIISGDGEKRKRLARILQHAQPPVILFVSTRNRADNLAHFISKSERIQWRAAAMHGGKNQLHRGRILNDFKEGSTDILIATGLVERGLDVKGVCHVINYDLPGTIADYVHRIGRTGRMSGGKMEKGEATTFVTPSDDKSVIGDLN